MVLNDKNENNKHCTTRTLIIDLSISIVSLNQSTLVSLRVMCFFEDWITQINPTIRDCYQFFGARFGIYLCSSHCHCDGNINRTHFRIKFIKRTCQSCLKKNWSHLWTKNSYKYWFDCNLHLSIALYRCSPI